MHEGARQYRTVQNSAGQGRTGQYSTVQNRRKVQNSTGQGRLAHVKVQDTTRQCRHYKTVQDGADHCIKVQDSAVYNIIFAAGSIGNRFRGIFFRGLRDGQNKQKSSPQP